KFDRCKNNRFLLENPLLVEEPLAVTVGQMYYLQTLIPEQFDFFEEFYNNPWVNVISKLAYPMVWHYLSNSKPIDDLFILNLAKIITQTFSLVCSNPSDNLG